MNNYMMNIYYYTYIYIVHDDKKLKQETNMVLALEQPLKLRSRFTVIL